MGNKILGKRSRSFYRGFNDRQLNYLKDKFETLSEGGLLKKELFLDAYKMSEALYPSFLAEADFEEGGSIEEYEFICFVSFLCNLTLEQLGKKIFTILSKGKTIKQPELLPFSSLCLRYNAYLTKSSLSDDEIKKANKNKFQKYDFDKSKTIDEAEFIKICGKDEDYKNWFYNMGFITKKQLDLQDQIYDLVDSDIGDEVERQLTQSNPNADRVKRGVEHRMQNDDQFQCEEVVGEQYSPTPKPWRKAVESFNETDFAGNIQESAPSQLLTLDYVLGYRSFDSRNNLRFDSKDRIICHQGSLGIVMNERLNRKGNERQFEQDFINEHKDDITCLDNVGDSVATGEAGTKPMIILWDTNKIEGNLRSNFIITKELTNSVATICFAPSKSLLAATCNDEDHKLVVYDLKELKELEKNLTSTKTGVLCAGPLTKSLVFDIRFAVDEKSLVAATVKEILFVTFEKGVVNSSRGEFGNFSPTMALCLLPLKATYKNEKKEFMLAGMGNGSIYFWEKDKCVKAVVGHNGSVSAICSRTDSPSFISGDKTGKVILWNDKFQKERDFTVPKTNCPSNMIVAINQNKAKQLLIGTKSSNAFLMRAGDSVEKAKVVMSGHCEGNLWAMVLHKSQPFLYTGGEDQRLLKWDYVESKKLLLDVKCPHKIRSLDFNHYAKLLLVGFYNGVIQCYNPDTLQKLQKLSYTKTKNPDQQALNLVKFEHYGKYFAACYSIPEFRITLIGVSDKELKVLHHIKFNEKIISLDISKAKENDVKYLRCNTDACKYEVYEISKDKPVKLDQKQKKYLKVDWDTHTVAFSPQTKGIFTQGVQEQDISCLSRSIKYNNVMLVGDKYSKIKLFNYPTISNKIYNKYEGHSNTVTAIQFNSSEDYVVSIGGEEKSILIWKYDPVLVKNAYVLQNLKEDSDDQATEKTKKRKKEEPDEFEEVVEEGEQAMAVSQFKGQIRAPRNFQPNPKKDNQPPKEGAKIYHAFGIRNKYLKDEVRSQCRFSRNGKQILFPTACLAVKMDIDSKKQDIFMEHKQDIVSFAVDRRRELMATGQMAQKNLVNPLKKILSIYIWDIENKKVLQKLDGFHTIAIVLLQFSPSGKLLFSCGNDDKNTFAVYDWRSGSVLYSGPVSRGKVNGISWRSETEFITCGNDHVKFWEQSKGRQGQFKTEKTESQVCCITSNNIYVTGGAQGNLYNWIGNTSSEPIKAHVGKVQALYEKKFFLFSGGDDGKILRWRKEQNGSIKTSDLFVDARNAFLDRKGVTMNEDEYSILSIDFLSEESEESLFVTRGCAAVHHNRGKFKIVTQGHYKGELWALAASNTSDTFITGGDDGTVRCWDIQTREEVKRIGFADKIRAVDWSPDGQRVVVADAKAKIYLYDRSLALTSEYTGKPFAKNQGKFSDGWVQEIKFSPNGELIAYGSHGQSNIMQFLRVEGKKLSLLKEAKAGTSAVLHIDWSRDSSMISLNTQAAELLFIGTAGNPISASSVCDEGWATWTQKFGFPVQGIFQGPDYSDINTVCRDPTKSFLAVGYDDQMIRFFKYPCYIPKQAFKVFAGHSSHVTRIRFCPNYMVSLGGEDKTIIVWEIEGRKEEQLADKGEESDGLDDLDEDIDIPSKVMERRKKKAKVQEFFEAADEGDEFMAVKPWLGAIKQPSGDYPKQTIDPPNANIKLDYVQGYRTKDCRQNLYFSDKQTLIFHAAAVLIYHDISNNSQTLLTDHNDDILSIAYHRPSGGVLTGELGPKPYVNYYRDTKLIHTFKGPVTKGVLAVAISPDGSRGVCIGMDEDHWVAVLDLQKGNVISKAKGGKKVVLKLGWVSNSEFVSVGINHYRYWTVDGTKLNAKENQTKGNFVSLDIGEGLILTGASAGSIYSWRGAQGKLIATLQKLQKTKTEEKEIVPASVVECIKIQKDFIAAGTKDGYIYILDKTFKKINAFILQNILSSQNLKSEHPSVRSLDFLDSSMLIGTFGSEIYEIEAENISKTNCKIKKINNHMKCHYSPNNTWTNEVWGLAVHEDLIFTCSDDATLRSWSINDRRLISCVSLNWVENPDANAAKNKPFIEVEKDKKTRDFVDSSKGRSVGVSPDGKWVVVGCKDGRVKIFTNKEGNLKPKVSFKHAKEWVSDIKFGYNLLILGSHDNAIYVYEYDEEGEFKRKYRPMQKHSSYITHIDVSRDSCYLQSTCGAYELLFWDLNTGKQITSGGTLLRDEKWATWTSNLGWPVQGIYPKCTDGTFIHSVDRSHLSINNTLSKDDTKSPFLLAAGNNAGKVCLYNFPCTIQNSKSVEGKGHSSHITNVRFCNDDQTLLSVGGEDQCLMYWRVRKNK